MFQQKLTCITWCFRPVWLQKDSTQVRRKFSLLLFDLVLTVHKSSWEWSSPQIHGTHCPRVRDPNTTKCTFFFHLSLLLSLCHVRSLFYISFSSFFYHVSRHRRTERKGRSILGKIGQLTIETEILRHPYSFSSHITLALLIILLRALTSSFPWPLTLNKNKLPAKSYELKRDSHLLMLFWNLSLTRAQVAGETRMELR